MTSIWPRTPYPLSFPNWNVISTIKIAMMTVIALFNSQSEFNYRPHFPVHTGPVDLDLTFDVVNLAISKHFGVKICTRAKNVNFIKKWKFSELIWILNCIVAVDLLIFSCLFWVFACSLYINSIGNQAIKPQNWVFSWMNMNKSASRPCSKTDVQSLKL